MRDDGKRIRPTVRRTLSHSTEWTHQARVSSLAANGYYPHRGAAVTPRFRERLVVIAVKSGARRWLRARVLGIADFAGYTDGVNDPAVTEGPELFERRETRARLAGCGRRPIPV
jgi:hypothetical protein